MITEKQKLGKHCKVYLDLDLTPQQAEVAADMLTKWICNIGHPSPYQPDVEFETGTMKLKTTRTY